MKTKLLLLFLVSVTVTNAQLLVTPGNTSTTTMVVSRDSDVVAATINLTNVSSKRDTFKWKAAAGSTIPSQWDIFEICDPYACLSANLLTTKHTFVMNANQVGIFKVDLRAFCTSANNASISFDIWNVSDSANNNQTLTFTYNVDAASCFNGISNISADNIKFYPNPVKNKIIVQGLEDYDNASIQIFNVIGSKVFEKEINTTEVAKNISLESLNKGVYLIKFYAGSKLLTTRKFVKSE